MSRPERPDGSEPGGAHATFRVRGGGSLRGELEVPGDKSISHRALLIAALADGSSTITGLSTGDDVARTRSAVVAMGAGVDADGPLVTVTGGRGRLRAPLHPVDLGNSGTGMRLLAGVAATVPGTTVLVGDGSLSARPMDRVADPLNRMGARVVGRGERCLPPLEITAARLHGIEYTPPMASAQVKAAVLFAGLAADGLTVVHETVATRAHTEEMLAAAGADITVERRGAGRTVSVRRSELRAGPLSVAGDPSQAAFWVVGGVVVAGSRITVTGVHLGAERIGYLGVLSRMGALVEVRETSPGTGTITARTSDLVGTEVDAEEIPSLDEVPILAVAAARATGVTRFRDVDELRVKESDRLQGTVDLVESFGGQARVEGDDLVVTGGGTWRPGTVHAHGDHRMAMAAAIAGAACAGADEETVIDGWETVATSYPGFAEVLGALTHARSEP